MRIKIKDVDEFLEKNEDKIREESVNSDIEMFGKLWDILEKYNIEDSFEWSDDIIVVCKYPEDGIEEQDLLAICSLGFNIDTDHDPCIAYGSW